MLNQAWRGRKSSEFSNLWRSIATQFLIGFGDRRVLDLRSQDLSLIFSLNLAIDVGMLIPDGDPIEVRN